MVFEWKGQAHKEQPCSKLAVEELLQKSTKIDFDGLDSCVSLIELRPLVHACRQISARVCVQLSAAYPGGFCGSCLVIPAWASSQPWCPPAVARGGSEDAPGGVSVCGLRPDMATTQASDFISYRRRKRECFLIASSHRTIRLLTYVKFISSDQTLCSVIHDNHVAPTVTTSVLR